MAQKRIYGLPVSPGIAIGTIFFLHHDHAGERRHIACEEIAEQHAILEHASQKTVYELERAILNVPEDLAEYRDIISAQIELARDPKLLGKAHALINTERISADWALENTISELCAIFQNMEDPYLRDRIQDIRSIDQRMRQHMHTREPNKKFDNSRGRILAAFDISPADVMEMDLANVHAILTVEGGSTTHSAILARSLRIPALTAMRTILGELSEGELAIVDSFEGCVLLNPDDDEIGQYSARRKEYLDWRENIRLAAIQPASTRDGTRIPVMANLDKSTDFGCVARNGADGIGLYRTEFAFMKGELPTEEELFQEYSSVAKHIFPDQLVLRTLDVGADKMLPIQATLREANPALGLRGIRFCLKHMDIFRTQLRALLRAGAHGNISILLPMICASEEVIEVRKIIRHLEQELRCEDLEHASSVPLGIMIETPAAVMIADELARHSDFFSIGTNDLIHYLLAIDRGNRHVSYLYNPLHPAVIRSLKKTIETAHKSGIPVSVCGELAADPCGLALLLGLGIDAVSAAPAFVPGMKQIIRKLDSKICEDLEQRLFAEGLHNARELTTGILQKIFGSQLAFYASNLSTKTQP